MTEKVLIICLIILFSCTVIALALTMKKLGGDIESMQDAYVYLRSNYDHITRELQDVNSKYATSLDEREKSYDDIMVRYKKLEMELEAKDKEIIELEGKLALLIAAKTEQKLVDTSKGPDSEVLNGNT